MHLPYGEHEFLSPNSWVKHYYSNTYTQMTSLKQRQHDFFIMDVLHPYFTHTELFRINKVRLHLQILVTSDITTLDGKHVLPNMCYQT